MAIALSKEKVEAQNGVVLVFSYITLFIVNTLIIYIANKLFPNQVALGTYALSPTWSLYLAVIELTILCTLAMPVVVYYAWHRGRIFSTKEWMITYFIVNTLAIWGIARFADKIGFGISAWYVAIILGAVLDWVQGLAMMSQGKFLKKYL